jgi:effector-binding domain-containing protein
MAQYSIRLEHQPGIPLAVIRKQVNPGQLSRVVPECCGKVWQVLRGQGLRGGRNVAVYWDNGIRLEAGVEFQGEFAEQDGVIASRTPAGLVAAVTHFGPYGTLGTAHDAIHDWCRANHHQPLGPRWETYGHWQEEWNSDPSRIQTDVSYQVAPVP